GCAARRQPVLFVIYVRRGEVGWSGSRSVPVRVDDARKPTDIVVGVAPLVADSVRRAREETVGVRVRARVRVVRIPPGVPAWRDDARDTAGIRGISILELRRRDLGAQIRIGVAADDLAEHRSAV